MEQVSRAARLGDPVFGPDVARGAQHIPPVGFSQLPGMPRPLRIEFEEAIHHVMTRIGSGSWKRWARRAPRPIGRCMGARSRSRLTGYWREKDVPSELRICDSPGPLCLQERRLTLGIRIRHGSEVG